MSIFRSLAPRALIVVILATTILSVAARPAAAATSTRWRQLVLVYRTTDVTYTWQGTTKRLRTSMSSTDVSRAVNTVTRTPATVNNWSSGLASMQQTVVYPTSPLRKVSLHPNPDYGFWVSPADIAADLDTYAPRGRYDSVMVIWRKDTDGGQAVPSYGWGWSYPKSVDTNGAYYSIVSLLPGHAGWPGVYPEEVFVHEWMHQALFFYGDEGYPMPNLDNAPAYGYQATNDSWKTFLSDTLRGRIPTSSGTIGIKPFIWALGTPTNYYPKALSMYTAGGTSYVGKQSTITMTYSDDNGWRNLNWATAILRDPNGRPTVQVIYNQNTNRMSVRKLDGSGWTSGTPGQALVLRAGHVNVNLRDSSISASGKTLTIRWAFTFQSRADNANYQTVSRARDDKGILSADKRVGARYVR